MLPLVFQEYFIVLFRHTVDHPNLEMAMTVSYVSNGIDGSQCAYQCLTADKKIVFRQKGLKLLIEFNINWKVFEGLQFKPTY